MNLRSVRFIQLLIVLIGPAALGQPQYLIEWLQNTGQPESKFYGRGLNNTGGAIGSYLVRPAAPPRAVRWQDGSFNGLEIPPDTLWIHRANGINDAGVAVGVSGHDVAQAIRWNADTGYSFLETLPGTSSSTAHAINDLGEIAGVSGGVPVRWGDSAPLPLDLLSPLDAFGVADGINNTGLTIGFSGNYSGQNYQFFGRGVHWAAGSSVANPLPLLPGMEFSRVRDLNDNGEIVGSVGNRHRGDFYHYYVPTPVRWDAEGDLHVLPLLPGHTVGSAESVNDDGTIVGLSGTFDPATGEFDYTNVVWSGDAMFAFDSTIAEPWPDYMHLVELGQINDLGQIIGTMGYGIGLYDAFVATPIPEPGSSILVGIALVLLMCNRRSARRERSV